MKLISQGEYTPGANNGQPEEEWDLSAYANQSGRISKPDGQTKTKDSTTEFNSTDSAKEPHLSQLLKIEGAVGEAACKEVTFSPPLITRYTDGIIGRGTINIIQGAYGSHKSRFAEVFAALMLAEDTNNPQFLDFKRAELERFCVCYIDTERNQSEELPYAIQGIKLRAGYHLSEKPTEFRFTSIKSVERPQRFPAIETFIGSVRKQTDLHLFVLIDVVTDAIGDFNDPKESMKLFDFLGNLCDRYNSTFLLVIHQNPGTEKARGHTGTEAANKASTVLQIGFEKSDKGEETDLIKLRYLKLRRGKRPEPVYLQYSDEAKGLLLATTESVNAYIEHRKHKADAEDIAERLESLLSEGALQKGEVVKILMSEFSASNKTIRERLKAILEQEMEIIDEDGDPFRLYGYKEGKNEYYKLIPYGPDE